jgi:hypothetical protein
MTICNSLTTLLYGTLRDFKVYGYYINFSLVRLHKVLSSSYDRDKESKMKEKKLLLSTFSQRLKSLTFDL